MHIPKTDENNAIATGSLPVRVIFRQYDDQGNLNGRYLDIANGGASAR
jgi:hypothetical protein